MDPVFQRPLDAPAQAAVERAVKFLARHGYQVSAQSALEASLVHSGGVAPDPPRHGVRVGADGQTLTMSYLKASLFDAPPSPAELSRFEQLVEQTVAAARSGAVLSFQEWQEEQAELKPGQPKTPAFCPDCGTRAEPGAASCAMCGASF